MDFYYNLPPNIFKPSYGPEPYNYIEAVTN